ncbi:Chloride channel protein CLC-c [Hibiscus syriacus]|uniref:Chloride channel protein CLC-c n=1 Tax=Hibiscus syriacus TaxID=106335 RepID=A0A6A3ASP2_HIBSY|nr:Chloride channel protein CLC-c [Hibiscus syriacus]
MVKNNGGFGIPEVKAYLNGVDAYSILAPSTLFVKIFCSIFGVAAGFVVGKEGPMVHTGSCIASSIGQGGSRKYGLTCRWLRYFKNDRDRRDLITCGAAAGVAAAFRAPVGGVLFALEEVASWYLPLHRHHIRSLLNAGRFLCMACQVGCSSLENLLHNYSSCYSFERFHRTLLYWKLWRSALLWRTFFTTAVVAIALRGFIELCSTGNCGLFGEGLIMYDISAAKVVYSAPDTLAVILLGVIGGFLGSLYNYLVDKLSDSLFPQKRSCCQDRTCYYDFPVNINLLLRLAMVSYVRPLPRHCIYKLPQHRCIWQLQELPCPPGHYNDLASLFLNTNDNAIRNLLSTNTAKLSPWGSSSLPYRLDVATAVSLLTNDLLVLPLVMLVLLISKTMGDMFNKGVYDQIVKLKGLPYMEAHPEHYMKHLVAWDVVIGPLITFSGVEGWETYYML